MYHTASLLPSSIAIKCYNITPIRQWKRKSNTLEIRYCREGKRESVSWRSKLTCYNITHKTESNRVALRILTVSVMKMK